MNAGVDELNTLRKQQSGLTSREETGRFFHTFMTHDAMMINCVLMRAFLQQ